MFQNLHDASLEGLQLAIGGDATLWEDGQQITLAQHLGSTGKRGFIGRWVFLVRRNRNGLGQLEQPAQHGCLKDAVIHHKVNGSRAGRHEQDGIDKAHMVADQQGCPFARNILLATHLEAIDKVRDDPGHKTQQIFGHQQEHIERHDGIGNASHQEHLRNGAARCQQRTCQHSRGNHEQRVQDVVGRNNACTVRGQAAHLNQRIHGHAVNAGRQCQHAQVHHHAPVFMLGKKGPHPHQL